MLESRTESAKVPESVSIEAESAKVVPRAMATRSPLKRANKIENAGVISWTSGKLTLTVPSIANGKYAVQVRADNKESNVVDFTVTGTIPPTGDAPVVMSISPKSGTTDKNTAVSITGTGLLGVTQVKLTKAGVTDKYASSVVPVNDNLITCTVGLGYDLGTYEVTLIKGSTSSLPTSDATFTVLPASPKPVADIYNYPNPFDPVAGESTKIKFTVNVDMAATVYIFDITGRIQKKFNLNLVTGENEYIWNGADDFGSIVGNGVYLLRAVSDGKLIGKAKLWVVKK